VEQGTTTTAPFPAGTTTTTTRTRISSTRQQQNEDDACPAWRAWAQCGGKGHGTDTASTCCTTGYGSFSRPKFTLELDPTHARFKRTCV
jgi:hypothetical protein